MLSVWLPNLRSASDQDMRLFVFLEWEFFLVSVFSLLSIFPCLPFFDGGLFRLPDLFCDLSFFQSRERCVAFDCLSITILRMTRFMLDDLQLLLLLSWEDNFCFQKIAPIHTTERKRNFACLLRKKGDYTFNKRNSGWRKVVLGV